MAGSFLEEAFAHHVWATKRLAEACAELTPEQQAQPVHGTYGSVLATMRHIVGNDAFYLSVLTGHSGEVLLNHRTMDVRELSAAVEALGKEWISFLAGNPDPDMVVREVDPGDGFQRDAPLSVHIVQALHHGNEHRTHICTALTSFGGEPPDISAFKFALEMGRSVEVMPPA
jgi:uncharacterized damage-inducible protein DinB